MAQDLVKYSDPPTWSLKLKLDWPGFQSQSYIEALSESDKSESSDLWDLALLTVVIFSLTTFFRIDTVRADNMALDAVISRLSFSISNAFKSLTA